MSDRAFSSQSRQSPTFRAAAESYIKHGGERRYLAAISDHFGETPVAEIVPWDIKQMALALYPEGQYQGATRNRQAITPARAVMIHGYERGWCSLIRLTRFKEPPRQRKSPASPTWTQLFVRQADRDGLMHLSALVLFMAQTGARVSEAVRLQWREVDFIARTAMLLRTKTETNSVRHLTDELVSRLRKLGDGRASGERVFRYVSRYSVNERIKAVCERAEITYKSPSLCGRHAFATNAMAAGADIKTAMEAGGWKSSVIFLETYVHSKNAGRAVADRFNAQDFKSEDI